MIRRPQGGDSAPGGMMDGDKATHRGKDTAHAADSKLHEVGHDDRLTSLNP